MRFQHHLHRTATVRNDLIALAVRIETLIITSSGQSVRPPRAVALGLAVYLWSLGKTLPPVEGGPGAEVFARACAGCHADAALAGDPVPLAMVAAASPIGESPERGTGHWRVPSLRGVGDRRPLLADASVDSLDALLDPRSKRAAHRFGRDLSAADRAALLDWLKRR